MIPVVVEHQGVLVVRDDRLRGGTKVRAIPALLEALDAAEEVVYCSPVSGYAQIALAIATAGSGRRVRIFTPARKTLHPRTLEAMENGAVIDQFSPGYMTVLRARAREYAERTGATILPFGLDHPVVLERIAAAARETGLEPRDVWVAAGSGTLSRALQLAWPSAVIHAVRVGTEPRIGRARLYLYPRAFDQPARSMPPFPSVPNYDAKAWEIMKAHYVDDGTVFWNVAGAER